MNWYSNVFKIVGARSVEQSEAVWGKVNFDPNSLFLNAGL